MKTRRRARRIALETLYEYDIVGHDPAIILEYRLDNYPIESAGVDFAQWLIFGVIEHQTEMDILISRYAPEWPLDQMAVIDRNTLRIAIFEFLVDGQTPVKVAINEAVELAKNETPTQAIRQTFQQLTGMIPKLGPMLFVEDQYITDNERRAWHY